MKGTLISFMIYSEITGFWLAGPRKNNVCRGLRANERMGIIIDDDDDVDDDDDDDVDVFVSLFLSN